jgi:branched-chain amino acid transport system permease protein
MPRLSSRYATPLALAVLVAAIPWFFPSGYYFRVAALVWVSGLAAVGLQLLMGQAGQVSLGHAGFVGLGAYAMALGRSCLGLPCSHCCRLGAAAAAGLPGGGAADPAAEGALPGRRDARVGCWSRWFWSARSPSPAAPTASASPRRDPGLAHPRRRDLLLDHRRALLIGVWIALNLQDSPSGRALAALHDSEVAARTVGIDVAATSCAPSSSPRSMRRSRAGCWRC